MKTIIGDQIGMIIGCFISSFIFEPKFAVGTFVILNIGYWIRYISEVRGNKN